MTYENKMDRFHLEELIQQAWQTKDDLETLLWKMCDDPSPPTEDEIQNTIIGMIEIHDNRCRRLLSCFEKLLEKGDIKSI